MIARSGSLPLMVSAAAPDGAIVRRETRGGTAAAGRVATQTAAPATTAPMTRAAPSDRDAPRRRHAQGRGRYGTAVSNAPPAPAHIADVPQPPFRDPSRRHRCSTMVTVAGVVAGSARPVRFAHAGPPRACRRRPRRRTRAAPSASRRARSRTPRCRRACRRPAARLLGAHVGGGAEDHALRVSPTTIVGDCDRSPPWHRASGADAFARPKSSTFTVPSGVILMFAGFRSRWTMPLLVRGFERVGDLPRDGERRHVERHRASSRRRSASVSPSTSSSTRARDARRASSTP